MDLVNNTAAHVHEMKDTAQLLEHMQVRIEQLGESMDEFFVVSLSILVFCEYNTDPIFSDFVIITDVSISDASWFCFHGGWSCQIEKHG
jgi:hypothetical protein